MSRFSVYGLENIKVPVKGPMVVNMVGFTDPVDAAQLRGGLEGIFINPHDEIISLETQQIEETMKDAIVQTVVNVKAYRHNLFDLGVDVIKSVNRPQRTVFIIEEQDLEHLEKEGENVDQVVSLLKDKKMSVVNSISEARQRLMDNYDSVGEDLGIVANSAVTETQLVNSN